jgi:hypothetical protein
MAASDKTPATKTETTEKPAPRKGFVQAVHGDMVHPSTVQRFEHLKPTEADLSDSWVAFQIKHGKLTEYKLG